MQHSKTIAIARGILAEGRLSDAARMIEPLLNEVPSDADVGPGLLTLRCLMARIAMLYQGDHRRALHLLEPYGHAEARAELNQGLRGEVALWLGWARVWQVDETYDHARALNLLDEAERAFDQQINPSGQCWTLLGRALAYFSIDEYRLMIQAVRDAAPMLEKLEDAAAASWMHHLAAAGARCEGRYRAATHHASELERLARTTHNRTSLGRATAHRAAIDLENGRSSDAVLQSAARAIKLLTESTRHADYALLTAYDAAIGALVRGGRWSEVEPRVEAGLAATKALGPARHQLALHTANIAVHRGDLMVAATLLEQVSRRVPRQHLHVHSLIELARSRCLSARQHYKEARSAAARAQALAREAGYDSLFLRTVLQEARVALAARNEEEARECIRRAEQHADYFSLLPFAAERFYLHGQLHRLRNRTKDAHEAFAQSLSAYSLIGDAFGVAMTQFRIAELTADNAIGDSESLAVAAAHAFDNLGVAHRADEARRLVTHGSPGRVDALQPGEAAVGSVLARSAYSVELVSEAWLQAAEEFAPDRWLVVYRADGPDDWQLVHRHGDPPEELAFPDLSVDRACSDGVDWIRLRGLPAPAFYFGMECGGDDDPACAAIERKLLPWIPVVGLAIDHALLRADRLSEADGDDADRRPSIEMDGFVYTSPDMRRVARQVRRLRSSHSPVLVTGESGVGKSVVARAIHDAGDRRDGPFVPFSCSGISPDDTEEALFGAPSRTGALLEADHGTLYLSSIHELPLRAQHRLLRFLTDGSLDEEVRRAHLDVRILASTDQDLRARVRKGGFLEDLYYRVGVVTVHVPPLRERRDDIPLLVHHFLKELTHGLPGSASVTSGAMNALVQYDWPGNVRQLRNEIERVLVYTATEPVATIAAADLSDSIQSHGAANSMSMATDGSLEGVALNGRGLDEIMANAERSVIEQVLARHDGQVSAAAEVLGLSRQGLYKKLKRLGIDASALTQG